MSAALRIDVALVPHAPGAEGTDVAIVVDQVRASTTITTLLDAGCERLLLAGSLRSARLLARATGSLLAGERGGVRPRGFDFDNSPTALFRAALRGRSVVLTTTNGTAVLRRHRHVPHVLVGCTRNAGAVATGAVRLALADADSANRAGAASRAAAPAAPGGAGTGSSGAGRTPRILVVCAGLRGRFALEDAVAAGAIVRGLLAAAPPAGGASTLTDGARAALHLRDAYPDLLVAMEQSEGGRALRQLGRDDDTAFCAGEDASTTVPILRDGDGMEIVRLDA